MIYGELRLRDRLIRALIGSILGAGAGLLFMLQWDMFSSSQFTPKSGFLLPATGIGALIGGWLAFRRTKI